MFKQKFKMNKLLKYLLAVFIISVVGYSQTNNESSYDYVKAFETAFYYYSIN